MKLCDVDYASETSFFAARTGSSLRAICQQTRSFKDPSRFSSDQQFRFHRPKSGRRWEGRCDVALRQGKLWRVTHSSERNRRDFIA
jgi:hypothetical protein